MEYLQYDNKIKSPYLGRICFKPCYKWNTFNTGDYVMVTRDPIQSFKPCYKRNTFNTELESLQEIKLRNQVLNFIINGLPSIQKKKVI